MDEYKVSFHCRNNLFICIRSKRYIRSKRKAVTVIVSRSKFKFRKRSSNCYSNTCDIRRGGLGKNSIPHSFVIAIRYGNELERNLRIRHYACSGRHDGTYIGNLNFLSTLNMEVVSNRKTDVIDPSMIYELLFTVKNTIIIPVCILEINRVRDGNCFCGDNGHRRKAVRDRAERRQVAPGIIRSTIAGVNAPVSGVFYIPCSNIVF